MDKRSKALVTCLCIATAAWVVMLAGVASLQSACNDDILPELENSQTRLVKANLLNIRAGLAAQKNASAQGANAMLPSLLLTQSEVLKALAVLTKRSAATLPPIFTPDFSCSDFYRWPWATMSIEATTLLLIWTAFFSGHMRKMVVPGSTFLTLCMGMSLVAAHTFFYIRHIGDELTDRTFARGKLFFAGCVFVTVGNALVALVLGAWNELCEGAMVPGSSSSSEHSLPVPSKDAPVLKGKDASIDGV